MESHNKDNSTARVGDWLEVAGVAGSPPRRGEISEILGAPGHTHFRVRWDEGHEFSSTQQITRRSCITQPTGGIDRHERYAPLRPSARRALGVERGGLDEADQCSNAGRIRYQDRFGSELARLLDADRLWIGDEVPQHDRIADAPSTD